MSFPFTPPFALASSIASFSPLSVESPKVASFPVSEPTWPRTITSPTTAAAPADAGGGWAVGFFSQATAARVAAKSASARMGRIGASFGDAWSRLLTIPTRPRAGTTPRAEPPPNVDRPARCRYRRQPMGAKILLVDDNQELLVLLSRLVEQQGWTPVAVLRGKSAIDAIPTEQPAAAVVDVLLPDMMGYDVGAALRKAGVPFIFMTGVFKGGRAQSDARAQHGAAAYFEKPFDSQKLVDRS